MKAVGNMVIVQAEKAFDDEITTEGGLILYRDVTFKPEHWRQQVVQVVVSPAYISGDYQTTSGKSRVKTGDYLYVSYLCIRPENVVYIDGRRMYRIPYSEIFAVIRPCDEFEGPPFPLTPINGNVFVTPSKAPALESETIITLKSKEKSVSLGTVVCMDPDIEDNSYLPGTQVYFNDLGAYTNMFNKVEYYIMRPEDILAKVTNVE